MWSIGRSDLAAEEDVGAGEWPWPLVVSLDRRARRLKLRLDPHRRRLVLTCPPRTSRRAALAWAARQRDWAAGEIARIPAGEPFEPGAAIPFDGGELRLVWDPAAPRKAVLSNSELTCGGPRESFDLRVHRCLRLHALRLLTSDTEAAAAIAGVTVAGVSVGDAETRWGSCSSAGTIRYNWRLAMAPPSVRRWVVAHEVAHRVHMNHGVAFKRLEQRIYGGDVAAARSELRRIAARLKGIGRRV